jgi:phosphate transport system permease protein
MQQKNIFQDNNPDFLNSDSRFSPNMTKRKRIARVGLYLFQASLVIAILALSALLYTISNDAFGLAAFKAKVDPMTLTGGRPLEDLTNEELITIIQENTSANRYKTLEKEKLLADRSQQELIDIIINDVVKPTVIKTWTLVESIFQKEEIEREITEEIEPQDPGTAIYTEFMAWLNWGFNKSPQNSNPMIAGISTAILGSLMIIVITMLVAIPIGVGAAIYLEEYANPNLWVNQAIQTNINNLAAVPSIIYGMLGLTIFVRGMAPFTSGAMFGYGDSNAMNGRTILSAGMTLGILVLPLIIINSQEAIRSVPNSLRQAGYGLGSTKWQTILAHVLPNSIPGILTGTILAISRAFGETAPLIVVGVSTYITSNPTSIFSQFTTLPAQIYQWTARPQDVWRSLAAAASIVLLILLIALNSTAILLRNKYSRKY